MQSLKAVLERIHPFSTEFWQELSKNVTEDRFPKKKILLREGEVSQNIWFIVEGLARAYYFKRGIDVTSWIMRENDLIISVNSFFTQTPSYETIELLEESKLISIDRKRLLYLYEKFEAFNIASRILTEKYYVLSEQRIYSMRMHSAPERYQHLLSSDPEIFQRVPLKYIASYLSMKAETLSRIRAAR